MAKIKKKSALIAVFILAAIAGVWRFIWQPAKDELAVAPSSQTTSSSPETAVVNEVQTEKTTSIKTSYSNPGGSDEVGFGLTVNQEGVITKASVEVLAKNPTSKIRQEAFAKEFPQAVEGKKLSDLTAIDKVGGSSLTTASFNASLAQLKAGI